MAGHCFSASWTSRTVRTSRQPHHHPPRSVPATGSRIAALQLELLVLSLAPSVVVVMDRAWGTIFVFFPDAGACKQEPRINLLIQQILSCMLQKHPYQAQAGLTHLL